MNNLRSLQSFTEPHLLTDSIRRFFSGKRKQDLSGVMSALSAAWSVYVMGGLLRNLLLEKLRNLKLPAQDVDLVVIGATSRQELLDSLDDLVVSRNHFGGAKCLGPATGLTFDIWRADDHVGMSNATAPPTIDQVLEHNLLDLEAVAWNCRSGDLYEYGCLTAIERAEITVLPQGIDDVFADEQVAHLLIVTLKTGFALSDDAKSFVRRVSRRKNFKEQITQVFRRKAPDSLTGLELLLEQLTEKELVS